MEKDPSVNSANNNRQDLLRDNKDIVPTIYEGKDGKLYSNREEGFSKKGALSNAELEAIDAHADLIRGSLEERRAEVEEYERKNNMENTDAEDDVAVSNVVEIEQLRNEVLERASQKDNERVEKADDAAVKAKIERGMKAYDEHIASMPVKKSLFGIGKRRQIEAAAVARGEFEKKLKEYVERDVYEGASEEEVRKRMTELTQNDRRPVDKMDAALQAEANAKFQMTMATSQKQLDERYIKFLEGDMKTASGWIENPKTDKQRRKQEMANLAKYMNALLFEKIMFDAKYGGASEEQEKRGDSEEIDRAVAA